ncbi:hypothetical protein AGMMS50249_7320 [candidate division SR1 bacterium]|nr:hypothetical protein AGMMS50249_7320 [candidate division SR1 bacterium]
MLITFPNDGRKLKKLIMGLLKSHLATSIIRLNYAQSYTLFSDQKKIEKSDLKLIKIETDKSDQVQAFLTKNFPEYSIFSF